MLTKHTRTSTSLNIFVLYLIFASVKMQNSIYYVNSDRNPVWFVCEKQNVQICAYRLKLHIHAIRWCFNRLSLEFQWMRTILHLLISIVRSQLTLFRRVNLGWTARAVSPIAWTNECGNLATMATAASSSSTMIIVNSWS